MKQPKLLITGASGFVGYHLVHAAKTAGYTIHATIRRSSKTDDIVHLVDKFVEADFSNVEKLGEWLEVESYTYIIHAAALTKAKRESDMQTVNIDYTINLLTAAFSITNPPIGVHILSSLAAIGPLSYNGKLIDESSAYQPVTVYGRSKMRMEQLVREQFADKPIRIFRPTAVYGPKDKDIFILLQTLNKGIDAYIGRNPQALTFIYVKDLANLLIGSLDMPVAKLECYNLTDGGVYDRYQLANLFKQITQKRMLRLHVPFAIVKQIASISEWLYKSSTKTPVLYAERLKEITAGSWACDIAKAKQELLFEPRYDLEAGLTESLTWYKEHHWL
ncbi:NAD-dependent epimerase/dehydratase family protein [Sphingobacterium corticibacter]|uniref:NAD(P)-dependent oxidoreductase n=1 Tax=Sphingobacterium corticibacter TaxID=2171749 RepID=A0A2T8HF55_9SPHI|nr:NAD-dependent epimerase/dehydratase family protein [Sphingobacterium corticibacter]PVH24068.1 NAD(P)-dependent oxidoreductase [Sphingobacterium corticibacter]